MEYLQYSFFHSFFFVSSINIIPGFSAHPVFRLHDCFSSFEVAPSYPAWSRDMKWSCGSNIIQNFIGKLTLPTHMFCAVITRPRPFYLVPLSSLNPENPYLFTSFPIIDSDVQRDTWMENESGHCPLSFSIHVSFQEALGEKIFSLISLSLSQIWVCLSNLSLISLK